MGLTKFGNLSDKKLTSIILRKPTFLIYEIVDNIPLLYSSNLEFTLRYLLPLASVKFKDSDSDDSDDIEPGLKTIMDIYEGYFGRAPTDVHGYTFNITRQPTNTEIYIMIEALTKSSK